MRFCRTEFIPFSTSFHFLFEAQKTLPSLGLDPPKGRVTRFLAYASGFQKITASKGRVTNLRIKFRAKCSVRPRHSPAFPRSESRPLSDAGAGVSDRLAPNSTRLLNCHELAANRRADSDPASTS